VRVSRSHCVYVSSQNFIPRGKNRIDVYDEPDYLRRGQRRNDVRKKKNGLIKVFLLKKKKGHQSETSPPLVVLCLLEEEKKGKEQCTTGLFNVVTQNRRALR
jgi:hypothetical protein